MIKRNCIFSVMNIDNTMGFDHLSRLSELKTFSDNIIVIVPYHKLCEILYKKQSM